MHGQVAFEQMLMPLKRSVFISLKVFNRLYSIILYGLSPENMRVGPIN